MSYSVTITNQRYLLREIKAGIRQIAQLWVLCLEMGSKKILHDKMSMQDSTNIFGVMIPKLEKFLLAIIHRLKEFILSTIQVEKLRNDGGRIRQRHNGAKGRAEGPVSQRTGGSELERRVRQNINSISRPQISICIEDKDKLAFSSQAHLA